MKKTIFALNLITLAVAGVANAEQATLAPINVTDTSGITDNWKTITERNVGSSLKDVLADRADINTGGGSVSAQYMSIRSMGQNQIDVVVDNATTATQVWYHQGRFQLDPAMVKTINVDKGTGSASAGIGRITGAVRAETVDAKDLLVNGKSFGAKVGTQVSSNKGTSANLALYGDHNGLDVLLLASGANDRNYKDGDKKEIASSARKQANYLAKLGYQFSENHKLGVSYRQERYFGDSAERPEFMMSILGPIETMQRTANLQYKGSNLGFIRDVDFNVFHTRIDDERLDSSFSSKVGQRLSNTKTVGSNLNFTSSLFKDHLLKYGFNWRNERTASKTERTNISVDGERKNEYGVYLEAIWDLEPITLTTGIRYDHYDLDTKGIPDKAGKTNISDGSFNPSVSAIWDITDEFSLNAKLNYASRSPNLASANTLTDVLSERRKNARGLRNIDDNLKTEQARLAEMGFTWKHHGFEVNGSLFQQTVKNFYSPITSSTISNLGTVRTKGYDLDASYRLDGLTARLGMSYSEPKATFELANDSLDVVPQGRQFRSVLAYRFDKAGIELGWRGRYAQGKVFKTAARGANDTGIRERKGYGVHDLFLNWQPVGDTLNVNLSVNNITNKVYQSHSQRATAMTPIAKGREYVAGINYRF
ncbi:ligand-gated channel [Pasteurellaceae bacterium LFhippo2]|nr:ligand-gated channel [Pasteurellaceae bacterium LFhippo2]